MALPTWEFQSPSLRGSGRFALAGRSAAVGGGGFNPLHCGAVVASRGGGASMRRRCRVSIPFIAGQWSLPDQAAAIPGFDALVSIPFIAGQWSLRAAADETLQDGTVVSIPFIAGQWSLLLLRAAQASTRGLVSIPFIAGQWSLPLRRGAGTGAPPCFNPLHCGAVVASGSAPHRDGALPGVSIPFIAGQWSLRRRARRPRWKRARFQSPSLRGSGRFPASPMALPTWDAGFNPLHCGAVVASEARRG